MPDHATWSSPPLVLLGSAHEWASRSLETILGPAGYAVLRAYTGPDALARARSAQPDAIILDAELPQLDGLTACRMLRIREYVRAGTPIILMLAEPITRQRTLEALRAGASGIFGQPLDTEDFLLRLEAQLRAKLDADRAREESLVDPLTGLYNRRGLTRRARELMAQAGRLDGPLACVVFAPAAESEETDDRSVAADADADSLVLVLARALEASGRLSDTLGRLGPTEFAVLAPHTDAQGAARMSLRLIDAVERSGVDRGRPLKLSAGYDVVPDARQPSCDPLDLLARATSALRAARAGDGHSRIRPFQDG